MKSSNNRRIVKWVLPLAIPEIMCLMFFIFSFFDHNRSHCEAACTFAMIYLWAYTIICAVLIPDDLFDSTTGKTDRE